MDLDLDLVRPGRREKAVTGAVVRPLTEADLALLQADRGVQPPALKRLRHRHHALARALASGMKDWEAGLATGYDPSRVSILKADPTFKELVAFYIEDVNAAYADLHERLSGLAVTAADVLQERLEEEPDEIGTGQLQEIVKLGADRIGYGPQSTSTQVNVHVDLSKRLEAARKRVAERKLIDITPEGLDADTS